MTARVHVLDEQTINQIAAGEVIENAASVVKELVENALDAGATEITVEAKGGGRLLIRVVDNGQGMLPDDALLCLERHATSKIRKLGDVDHLTTMGFRGEALPSIASISKLTLLTRPKATEKGTLVVVEGGRILKALPADCAYGTVVEVGQLFYNVPARKKFQRSPAQDNLAIEKLCGILALGNPQVKFQLQLDQKRVLETVCADPAQRLSEVLGKGFADSLRPLKCVEGDYAVEGFIGDPSLHRHNRSGQYLFINRRPVTCPSLAYAVQEAYGTRLPASRFPLFVLHLTLPGTEVDVNVHPQKREVRLHPLSKLRALVERGVKESLTGSTIRYLDPRTSEVPSFLRETPLIYDSPPPSSEARQLTLDFEPSLPWEPSFSPLATVPNFILLKGSACPPALLGAHPRESLILVNQYLAQSRILFDEMEAREDAAPALQQLLTPFTLDLSPEESRVALAHLPTLKSCGLQLAEFGPDCVKVEAMANHLTLETGRELALEILSLLKEEEGVEGKKRRKATLALMAGRRACPFNTTLSLQEAQALIQRLNRCSSPALCPKGRPVVLPLNLESLAQQLEKK